MIGRTYLERGRMVVVLAKWRSFKDAEQWPFTELTEEQAEQLHLLIESKPRRWLAPRNVLIRREDGTLVVRPFRGLRKYGGSMQPAE